jgi:hypothetical protein
VCARLVVAPPISSGTGGAAVGAGGKAQALHLGGDVAHLLQRRRDQARQADGLRAVLARRVQDSVAGDHDPEVDDIVAVAAEHHADDVLADVVHVALDRGDDDPALAADAGAQLLGLDVGNQVRDGLLHHACRFDDLRQEHLAGAKEVADDVHAVHQRPFDHRQGGLAGGGQRRPAFFGVGHDEVGDSLDQGVRQAFLDRQLAPGSGRGRCLWLFPSLTVWANSTSASPASGRRLSTTSSTLSRSTGSRSS